MLAPFSSIKLSRSSTERKSIDKVSEMVEKLYHERYHPPRNYNIHVMVSEVNCTQPDCVPIETVVIIMSELKSEEAMFSIPKRCILKILKPITQVTQEDIIALEFPLMHDHAFTEIISKINVEPETLNREKTKVEGITESFVINVCDAIQELDAPLQSSLLPIMIERLQSIEREAIRRVELNKSMAEVASKMEMEQITTADSKNEEVVQTVKMKKREEPRVESKYQSTGVESEYFPLSSKDDTFHRLQKIESNFKANTPKGCSCCDPDNIDTILHQLLLQAPP
jgi:transcription termination factor NusB